MRASEWFSEKQLLDLKSLRFGAAYSIGENALAFRGFLESQSCFGA